MRLTRSVRVASSRSFRSVRGVRTGPAGRPIDRHAGLDDRDRVALLAVAQLGVGDDELVQHGVDAVLVLRADGVVERQRELGHEVEDRRGVGGHAELEQRQREDLGGGQAADVGQPVAHPGVGPGHLLDVADAVLEADQGAVALAGPLEGVGVQHGVGAAVDDDAERAGLADRGDVVDEPVLAGLGEVRGHQQQAVGAGLLGGAGLGDGVRGGAGRGGEDRDGAVDGADGGSDHPVGLGGGQREALTGAAGGEEAGDGVGAEPRQVLAVGRLVELAVLAEVGDGEGQQAAAEGAGQLVGGHVRHGGFLSCGVTTVALRGPR